ncbi:Dimeric alpha-beta barrel [Corchorus olitorius]|uniref:Dimeric alpha-beta barrel n=1 Tax=Corchorus olitorius TaxID=93759 RepID=A0A1R3KQ63_9ROSI|nr:Dimeric alpha-beta barrel [Corchorus olitorius]
MKLNQTDGTTPEKIEELIKGYAGLVDYIEPMKAFHWYLILILLTQSLSLWERMLSFTHVFESTFETREGIAQYVAHPVHVEFANVFLGHLEKLPYAPA